MFVQAKIQPVSLSDQEGVIICTCTYIHIYIHTYLHAIPSTNQLSYCYYYY